MGRMEWPELKSTALADQNFRDAAEAAGISPSELPGLFDIASQTPVRGEPATTDPATSTKVDQLRKLLDTSYGANDLYTGMGATLRETGELGAREIMLRPNGTGLRTTPDNSRKVNLGRMTQEHFDALFPPTTSSATPPPVAPRNPDPTSATPPRWSSASITSPSSTKWTRS